MFYILILVVILIIAIFILIERPQILTPQFDTFANSSADPDIPTSPLQEDPVYPVYPDTDIHLSKENERVRQGYTDAYPSVQDIGKKIDIGLTSLHQDIDDRNLVSSLQRYRDKKAIDGAIAKTSNFYKEYFADELEIEERKPWWGRGEL